MLPTCFLFLAGALGLPASKDWFPVPRLELLLRAKEAGNQEVKQGPEVEDVILDRRARQDETVVTLQLLHSLRDLDNTENNATLVDCQCLSRT